MAMQYLVGEVRRMNNVCVEHGERRQFCPHVSTHLPNGAEVVRRALIDDQWVWLCRWERNGRWEWISWVSAAHTPGGTFWGVYGDEQTVTRKYRERLGRYAG